MFHGTKFIKSVGPAQEKLCILGTVDAILDATALRGLGQPKDKLAWNDILSSESKMFKPIYLKSS